MSISSTTAGVSPDMLWYGHTRSGAPLRGGVFAVGSRFIPRRSRIIVPDCGSGVASDAGVVVSSKGIDLGDSENSPAPWNRWVDVLLMLPPSSGYQVVWLAGYWSIDR